MHIKNIVKEFLLQDNRIKYPKFNEYIEAILLNGYRNTNISAATYSKYNKYYLPNKPITCKPLNYILLQLKYKKCYKCNEIYSLDNFRPNKNKADGYNVYCKICQYITTKDTQTARSSLYRASKIKRTPMWVNLDKIRLFYANCPVGYHVDHIIPLNGEKVSGLHTIENLQYLPSTDNLSKSNKWDFRLIG